jgi:TRAP transporter TAXI family solute receptor
MKKRRSEMKRLFIYGFVIVTVLSFFSCLIEAREERLSISTCGSAGVWYPIGGGMAKLITENIPGIKATAEATGCSLENARLLKSKDSDLCMMMKGPLINAYKGVEEFKQDGPIPLFGIINTYASQLAVVTLKDLPINSFEDLRGKRISVGPPGSGTEVDAKKVLEVCGITYKDIKVHYLGWADSADALGDRNIDAFFLVGAHPLGAITDISVRANIKLIPMTEDLVKKIEQVRPDLSRGIIPGGVYRGVDKEVLTVETVNTLVARSGLSDDLIYKITKTLFEKREDLVKIHKYMKYLTPATAITGIPIPLHPGAERYWKEVGIKK